MKVLFIYPNSESQVGFNYGVASLSAELKAHGHQVDFWQLCEDIEPLPDAQRVADKLAESKPDLIGFSVVTNQWQLTAQVAQWCRQASDAPLVCGGIHATVAGEEVLESGLFDYILTGECEGAFLEFAEKLEQGQDVRDVANLGYLDGDKPVLNPVRPLPILTTQPRKDYSIFDFQRIIDAKRGWVGLMASRGCPFNCTYCFNHLMVKKYRQDLNCGFKDLNYIRHHSVEQMIDEIKFLEANYRNITMYIFDDDLFTYDRDFIVEFCKEYKKVSKMPFVVNGHVGFWDEERAKVLADAGCQIVKFGVESGSPNVRNKIMHRHMSNEAIEEAIAISHRYGMHSSCFIMFGLPHETEEDVMQTVQLMADALPGRYRWTFFYPFPGTESYQMAHESGLIDREKLATLVNFTDDSCLDFGPKQNLLLKKIAKILPWFVNAHSKLEVAPVYRELLDEILALDETGWQAAQQDILERDKALSARFVAEGKSHYAVKYNRFMGVISDYFVNE
ncbi:MAG: B12-binding domain-containing radical SAM protein [Desulfuromonadales bacterium]|nr:B12-binding domain-containing radical SAM protein [Desulfuromonadales bacterium]